MSSFNIGLIGRRSYKYNDNITLRIPTINQIHGDGGFSENSFWQEINLFSQTPTDNIAPLALAGIDFTTLSEYLYFVIMFQQMKLLNNKNNYKSQLFEGLNLWDLTLVENNEIITLNNDKGVVIDEKIYTELSELICYTTCREKTKPKKFGNEYAKKKRIEVEVEKFKKAKKNPLKEDSRQHRIIPQ